MNDHDHIYSTIYFYHGSMDFTQGFLCGKEIIANAKTKRFLAFAIQLHMGGYFMIRTSSYGP